VNTAYANVLHASLSVTHAYRVVNIVKTVNANVLVYVQQREGRVDGAGAGVRVRAGTGIGIDDPCFVHQGTVLLCCPYDICSLQGSLQDHLLPDSASYFQAGVNVSPECSDERWTCRSRDAMVLALSIHSDEGRVQDIVNDMDFVFVDTVPFLWFRKDVDADVARPLPVFVAGNDPRMLPRHVVLRDSKDS
jgi:hypothetical protein